MHHKTPITKGTNPKDSVLLVKTNVTAFNFQFLMFLSQRRQPSCIFLLQGFDSLLSLKTRPEQPPVLIPSEAISVQTSPP